MKISDFLEVMKPEGDEPYYYGYVEGGKFYLNSIGVVTFPKGNPPVLVLRGTSFHGPDSDSETIRVKRFKLCDDHGEQRPSPSLFVFDEDEARFFCAQCAAERGLNLVSPRWWDAEISKIETNMDLRELLKFGVEIEVAFHDRPFLPRPYHSRSRLNKPWLESWRGEFDRSIDDDNGIEFISPILRVPQYALASLAYMSDLLKRHSAMITHRTGIHVHVEKQNVDPKTVYALTTAMEELIYAVGGNWGRYTGNRYAPPMKNPRLHEGHYIAVNTTRRTFELRIFESSVELIGILLPIALTQAVVLLSRKKLIPPIRVKKGDKIERVVAQQWEYWTEYAGWHKGGEWLGWMYNPDSTRRSIAVTVGRSSNTYVLPGSEEIIERMGVKIKEFTEKLGDCTIADAMGGNCV